MNYERYADFCESLDTLVKQVGIVDPDFDLVEALYYRLKDLYYEKKEIESKDFKKDV